MYLLLKMSSMFLCVFNIGNAKKSIFSDLKFVAIFADFNEICSDLIFSDFLENAEKRCNLNSRNFSISI